MNSKNNNEKYLLQSVDNALALIDLLCQNKEMSLSEIANAMKLGKSTVFRLLFTLENRNFLYKDRNSKYRLSLKFTSIGNLVQRRMELVSLAHPFLEDLTKKTGETAHLVIWNSPNDVIFIDKVLGNSTIRMDSMVGMIRTAHLTATGKSLLAFSDKTVKEDYLKNVRFERKTTTSIKNKTELLEELVNIREKGYSSDDEESESGLTCFGAPLIDHYGHSVAAISISGPTERMNSRKNTLISQVKETAFQISSYL
ncbi:MAG: IclR family transcriptional regulator [Firmicutes bacterium HGW-Firmicutes-4]|jgi:DNA-binding IclR family transcriptional regulator|nr:MAG: IclR family transcriptional regulator [Firmicutes bacterium HGW-Firmicutes-4]